MTTKEELAAAFEADCQTIIDNHRLNAMTRELAVVLLDALTAVIRKHEAPYSMHFVMDGGYNPFATILMIANPHPADRHIWQSFVLS